MVWILKKEGGGNIRRIWEQEGVPDRERERERERDSIS